MKYRFTTTLDKELLDKIKIQAVREHRSVAKIIEELFRDYLARHLSHD